MVKTNYYNIGKKIKKNILKEEMDRYPKHTRTLTDEEFEKLNWAKFKIIVPTKEDAKKIRLAIRYLHDQDINTDYIWVNQIVHSYSEDEDTIVINDKLFDEINV